MWPHKRPSAHYVPSELTSDEKRQYETLLRVVERRREHDIEPPTVLVITDLAKDYDDLAALLVLKELDRLGVIKLTGVIANLMPAQKRAEFARGALDLLFLPDVPVAAGSDGSNAGHEVLWYEFECSFMADPHNKQIGRSGQGLLRSICQDAVAEGKKITLLLISSLKDIDEFSCAEPALLKAAVSNVVMQGGYFVKEDGSITPDERAANNRFDFEAAKRFHSFLRDIPSVAYTKAAAFATPLTSKLFNDMAGTGHALGLYLQNVQISQDLAFYKTACHPDPKQRFAPFMDQKWYLQNRTTWFDDPANLSKPYPEGPDVIPYLDKLVLYDALAGLGSAGADAIDALGVLMDKKMSDATPLHKVVADGKEDGTIAIQPEQMAFAISALMKGSLLTTLSFASIPALQMPPGKEYVN